MNDYKFGEYIYRLRTNAEMSQSELGDKLGVSNKAISKWENGKAKPHTDILRKIAALFEVSIDELLNMPTKKHVMILQGIYNILYVSIIQRIYMLDVNMILTFL